MSREYAYTKGREARRMEKPKEENPFIVPPESRLTTLDEFRGCWDLGWDTEERNLSSGAEGRKNVA